MSKPITEEMILDALRAVKDPDLHRDIVALNFTKGPQLVSLGAGAAEVALSTDHARDGDAIDLARVELRPDEGVVVAPASR